MIYWLILLSIILLHIIRKKENTFYLKLAFYIFIVGACLKLVTLSNLSEFAMRISFILWIIGLFLSWRWRDD